MSYPPAERTHAGGDGLSTASLITTWVGAAVPLLPLVTLLVAIAGRKSAATRWLNTVALVMAAIALAGQIIVVTVFGASIAALVTNVTNRDVSSVEQTGTGILGDTESTVEEELLNEGDGDTAPGGDLEVGDTNQDGSAYDACTDPDSPLTMEEWTTLCS